MAIRRDLLAAAKKAAAEEGLSLSGLLSKLVAEHLAQRERFANMDRFLRDYAPDFRVTDEQLRAIGEEMSAPLKPIRRSKRRGAA